MGDFILRINIGLKNIEPIYRLSSLAIKLIVFAPFGIVFFCFLLWSIPETRGLTYWLVAENHPVEIVTFLSLLLAAILGWRLAWQTKNNNKGLLIAGFYLVFATGLFFVAMEEVSWGQWFFGFETPAAIKAINKQGEFNFHNMPGLHAPFEMLRVAFGLGGLLGVWLAYGRFLREIGAPAILSAWFIVIALLAALDLHNYYIPLTCCPYPKQSLFVAAARMVEVLELLIGLSAFLYMWLNARMLAK
jgi:hypothetical protein